MNRVSHFPIETGFAKARTWLLSSLPAVVLVSGLLILAIAPLHAASATAQLGVTARVIQSCKVSADAIASQLAGANGTIEVNCQSATALARPAGSVDAALPTWRANVNYRVEEVPGSGGALKIITVNF